MSHAPQLMVDPDNWGLLNTRSWDLVLDTTGATIWAGHAQTQEAA